jgi:lipopolysaccharide transport system ATP-binding protein
MSTAGEPAIALHNISKHYYAYENQRMRLLHALRPSHTRGVNQIQALQNVSFELMHGESLGIVGRNGAGKSSLLQIVSKTVLPNSGTLSVNGRVAALLELGSGFNPEYSGRDNVILGGLLLGLTRAEIERRFDDIASFADIGNVLNRPVKTYSSGMMIRLAFSVQVALEPDILIVDEALSVGDYFFQQKCFARLRRMRDNGLTLLLVSHDMSTVRDTCQRVLYLKGGRQVYLGDAQEATRQYFADGYASADASAAVIRALPAEVAADDFDWLRANALWSCSSDNTGHLLAVHVMSPSGEHLTHTRLGSTIVVRVSLKKRGSGRPLAIKVILKNKYGQVIVSTGNRLHGVEILDDGFSTVAYELELDMLLEAGQYSCKVVCTDELSLGDRGVREHTGWIGPLRIDWDYEASQPPFFGMFGLPARSRDLRCCAQHPDDAQAVPDQLMQIEPGR